MNKQTKQNLMLITFGIVLYLGISNINQILQFIGQIINIILPLIIGGVLAFVLSVPMSGFEKLVDKISNKFNKELSIKTKNLLSLILTLTSLIVILVIVIVTVAPIIRSSIISVIEQLKVKLPEWEILLAKYNLDITQLTKWLDLSNIKNNLNEIKPLVTGIAGTVSSTFSIIMNALFSFIVMFYLLLFKKDLARQTKRLLHANLKDEYVDKIINLASLVRKTYSKFLSGQCIESLILGGMMLITLSICGLQYAPLIALLTCVCSFIPYIGAFISCGIGVFLTLLSSPIDAIICLVVYQIVQFIEGQFIYPRVVGSSVGMSPLYTFLAVLIGGRLFGIVGILFFIPLTAVIYTIVRDDTNRKLSNR